MLKRLFLALMTLTFAMNFASADDDVLSIDVASIKDATIETVDFDGLPDVDQLVANAGTENTNDAIEVCFRRCGYYGGGCNSRWYSGYRSYGCWNYGCNSYSYCSPCYSYSRCYVSQPYCYSTCVSSPCYGSYWGCY